MSLPAPDPLQAACEKDDADTLRRLIAAGADPRVPPKGHRPHLCWAARYGARRCVEILLDQGCAIDGEGKDTPLGEAIFFNKDAVVLLLLRRGADPNRLFSEELVLPLAEAQSQRVLKALLAHGADLERRCYSRFVGPGATPLLDAIAEEEDRKVALFLAHGADVRARGEWPDAAPIALVAARARWDARAIPCSDDAGQIANLRRDLLAFKARAERLAAAGAGQDGSEAEHLAWLRALDLAAMDRERRELQALANARAVARPDFRARIEERLGAADTISDRARLRGIVLLALNQDAAKTSPEYPALFALCCARQRTLAEHIAAHSAPLVGERGLAQVFADGDLDTLDELARCLSDMGFAKTPAWATCCRSLGEACRRLERYPERLADIRGRAWFKKRPDAQALGAVLKRR